MQHHFGMVIDLRLQLSILHNKYKKVIIFMATNVTKTSHFTSGAGNPISFSQIKAQFGGNTSDIKASAYLRNTGDDVDWDGPNASSISPRIPDATENSSVTSTNNDWTVDSLRDTITGYNVTQSGNNEELEYGDTNTSTWNGNLSRNVLKKFDVTGTIFANQTDKDALTFDGNLYNLEIEVDQAGAIYGEGGALGGSGGDALYVNNTYTKSDVEIRSYGRIWAGGGAGTSGNPGNPGGSINNCSATQYRYGVSNPYTSGTNLASAMPGRSCRIALGSGARWMNANQTAIRNRCRGSGSRRGMGVYPAGNYQCSANWSINCYKPINFSIGGGAAGAAGGGGVGQGFSNFNSPGSGNPGGSGSTNSCSGGSSTGNSGNPGNSGGKWGQSVVGGGSGGKSIQKRNARVEYYTNNTVKGSITNI